MTSRIRLVLEAQTPIAHFDTRTGTDNATNQRLTMTQPAILEGRRAYVPHVSENALRTVLFRRPLADDLVTRLGVAGTLPRAVLALLYSGGAMGGGSRVPGDETAVGHAVGALYPSLALLGGAVDGMILPRSKLRLSAWLVAQEYATAIGDIFPEEAERAKTVSAYDLVGDEVRTRGTGERGGNQMLYAYQLLAAGTRIAIELTIDAFASAETRAAVPHALGLWDGYIGGQGRQGRGRMKIAWSDDMGTTAPYLAHVEAARERMADGLTAGTLGAAGVLCAA